MSRAYTLMFMIEFATGIFNVCFLQNLLCQGLSFSEAAFATAVWFLAIAIFEVPTGYFADRFGRKKSVIFGVLGSAISYVGLGLVGKNALLAPICLGLAGISTTLMSGSKEAWLLSLFRTRKKSHDEDFWINSQLIGRFAIIFGAFAGAKLMIVNPAAVWGVAAISCLAAAVICRNMPDVHVVGASQGWSMKGAFSRSNITLPVALIFSSAFFFGLESGVRSVIFQPFLVNLRNGDLMILAYFGSSLAVVRLAGILFYKYFLKKHFIGSTAAVGSLLLFALAEALGTSASSFWTFFIPYAVALFSFGWYFPIRATIANQLYPERLLATFNSVDSMLENLGSAITSAAAGWLLTTSSLNQGWMVGAVFILVCAALFLAATKARDRSTTRLFV